MEMTGNLGVDLVVDVGWTRPLVKSMKCTRRSEIGIEILLNFVVGASRHGRPLHCNSLANQTLIRQHPQSHSILSKANRRGDRSSSIITITRTTRNCSPPVSHTQSINQSYIPASSFPSSKPLLKDASSPALLNSHAKPCDCVPSSIILRSRVPRT